MKRKIFLIVLVLALVFSSGLAGWSIANKDTALYGMQMADLRHQLELCRQADETVPPATSLTPEPDFPMPVDPLQPWRDPPLAP